MLNTTALSRRPLSGTISPRVTQPAFPLAETPFERRSRNAWVLNSGRARVENEDEDDEDDDHDDDDDASAATATVGGFSSNDRSMASLNEIGRLSGS
jgi:hypothetical protein